jgi:hypothetical protein
MLVLPGPVRVEMLFPHQPQEPEPPWVAAAENLAAIDRRFWEWVLWASGIEAAGKTDVVAAELRMLFDHLLAPLGGDRPPVSVADAIDTYRRVRSQAEEHVDVSVARRLEAEIIASL